jgi:sporulation protein YlmC with PRC-barrel domain
MVMNNKLLALAGAAFIASATLPLAPVPTQAQGQPQSLAAVRIDPVKLSTGYRASKVRGASVVNESGDRIGTIDDVIITQDGKESYAVIAVGGFLGMGDHLIAVPYSQLRMQESKIILPGATKDALKQLPQFKYS